MAETKVTKAVIFARVIERCGDDEEIVACMENELALIEKKNVKAKERNAKKRAIGDELQATVLSTINADPQTRDDILPTVIEISKDESLTVGKIQAKLNNLVEAGQIAKCKVKTEDGKQKTAYTLA
jgi:hypothetical protein